MLLVERKGALVEAHTGGFELFGLGLPPLLLGGFGHAGNGADDEVCLEAVPLLDGAVAEVLKLDLVGGAMFLGDPEDVGAGGREPF